MNVRDDEFEIHMRCSKAHLASRCMMLQNTCHMQEKMIEELVVTNSTLDSLMRSGEQRGVQKADEDNKEKIEELEKRLAHYEARKPWSDLLLLKKRVAELENEVKTKGK